MKRAVLWSVVGVIIITLVLAGIKALQIRSMIDAGKHFKTPPESVASAKVLSQTWHDTLSAIGSLSSVRGITLSTEISGVVKAVHFENGDAVQKGALLITLDTAYEEAQLQAAEAEAELARLDLDRTRKLRESRTIAQSELDAGIARQRQTEAKVAELQALIAKKQLRAPFDGVAGIRSVNPGQFVNAGEKLVTVQALDTLYVNFSLPQQEIAKLKTGLDLEFRTDAFPNEIFQGKLTAINPEADEHTRNLLLQGTLENKSQQLRSGLFGEISVVLPDVREVLLIPQTAVMYATSGDSVFVVVSGESDTLIAQQQFVRLGVTRGDFVEVTKGLKEGQEVVSAGAFKLRNGISVSVNNSNEPTPDVAPSPEDK